MKYVQIEEGSGNVYADLGLDDADDLYSRSLIGFHVFRLLKAKELKHGDIANLLHIAQTEVSHLMNGHFSRFTTDKLLDFIWRLNDDLMEKGKP